MNIINKYHLELESIFTYSVVKRKVILPCTIKSTFSIKSNFSEFTRGKNRVLLYCNMSIATATTTNSRAVYRNFAKGGRIWGREKRGGGS